MADPEIQQPSITLSKTIGGFYRVILHGPDNLQSQSDRPRFCEMDIARSWDKGTALKQAADWFDDLKDKTPDDSRQATKCEWHEDDDGWHSSCGKFWEFFDDGPEENGLDFCMKCGKPVTVEKGL